MTTIVNPVQIVLRDECSDIVGFREFLMGVETPINLYCFTGNYLRQAINLININFPVYM